MGEGWSGAEPSRPFLLGATAIVVGAGLVTALAATSRVDPGHARDIRTVAGTGTAFCALAVFVLSRGTWRQIGDRSALWVGCGALAIGVAAASQPEVLGAALGEQRLGDQWLDPFAVAALALAPVLFAAGLLPAIQRLRVGPTALTAGALCAVLVVALLVHAVPRLGEALSVSEVTSGGGVGRVAGGVALAAAWLALAVGYTVRGLRRRWLYSWAGLMLFALTLSQLAAGAATTENAWAVGGVAFQAMGVLVALVGSYLELARAHEDQTLRLFDSTLEAETADVRERVRTAGLRARHHDLINAITAIDGAAMILEREFERLSGADRKTLAHVVGSGTARLRALVEQETGEGRVSLAETAADVARDPAWPVDLELDVTPDLVAAGSPGETAEAIRQLVDCAARRAPTAPVTVRGGRDGPWVVLRVEDRGPTMARERRRAVTDPKGRQEPGHDDEMGVRIAARLMRGQGGDLWVEARPGGGTSFGICLPALRYGSGDEDGREA